MKVWISKYALSKGILEREAETSDRSADLVYTGQYEMFFASRGELHRTREDAVRQAEKMRLDKIASLRKQIAKLEKLRFDEAKVA
jgi:hypothetical protein